MEVAGPYAAVGPTQTGEFWTDPVQGADVVIELQLAGATPGNLPFRIAEVHHLTPEGIAKFERVSNRKPAPEEREGATGLALFRGLTVSYVVRDGLAIWEGDIILGRAGEIAPAGSPAKTNSRQSMGITSTSNRWPGGVIPYTIDPTMPNQIRVVTAIDHWNSVMAGTIRLVARTSEPYYVTFFNSSSASTCSAYVGYTQTAAQAINIGGNCTTGNVKHEIGHAAGLFHEHTREDRDQFVTILTQNIQPSAVSNFSQQNGIADDLGSYDYGSIMHYPSWAYSINGEPTIVTIPPGIEIGQREGLSAGDIAGVTAMYAAPAPPPDSNVTVTMSTNPQGNPVKVDGVQANAPYSQQWIVGSTHTIEAVDTSSGGTRHQWAQWNDGGARSHSVVAPATAATYTASYQTQHLVSATSSNPSLGTVTASPASADGFYNAGTVVNLTAVAAANACFASWSGALSTSAPSVSVTVNQPLTVVANFQSGAVTVSPANVSAPSTGTTVTVSVTANGGCSWLASTSDSWIQIQAGSGQGSGRLVFAVTTNRRPKPRTGSVTVGPATVNVTQAGK